MRNLTEPEVSAKLKKWKIKYDDAKTKYSDNLNLMQKYEGFYNGVRTVNGNPNKGNKTPSEVSINVRNIDFELVESQVDTSIPMPKIKAIHEEDVEKAKIIEKYLINQINSLDLKTLNDLQERTTPIQGACFSMIEWDNTKGYHCCVGDLAVTDIHPRQVIPQPGLIDIDKMDYIFIRTTATKEYVKRRWGKDVSTEEETDKDIRGEVSTDDIVTVVTAFYRNEDNGIGLYRWCGDVELEDLEDYEARHIKVCSKCGTEETNEKVCPVCGGKKFVDKVVENDTITLYDYAVDEYGNQIEVSTEIELPYYKPSQFPLVIRKNISKDKEFLGCSDVAVIEDQQDVIKKLGSKINEKLLLAGSVMTLPEGVQFEKNDKEFKIIRLSNPQQQSMINVITCQADVSKDMAYLEQNYSWAKSALGITDAFQGKYDASARSGKAKQYSINQTAGRLESKRVLKNRFYAKLYELMFKYALAYADQPVPVNGTDKDGNPEFSHFDKRDFLKQDANGEWYWNDEFIFDIDPTSTLLTNREAMWNQMQMQLQSGAFGTIGDIKTMYRYWKAMELHGYPNAGELLADIEKDLVEQKQMAQMQQQMPINKGENRNEMPLM